MKKSNILITSLLFLLNYSCNCGKESKTDTRPVSSYTIDSVMNQIHEVVGIGKIEPESQILFLASPAGGIVTRVLKSNGDRVKAGETIITLDPETEQNNIELIKARIQTQENQVKLDQYEMKETELRLADKSRLLESTRRLVTDGAETSRNLDELETEVKILETGLLKDKANLSISESKLSELKTELRLAQIELSKRILTAPVDGIILDIMVTMGSSINQFSEFCQLAPDGKIMARCEIDEMFADRVKTGQGVKITPVGSNDIIATGKVIRTAPFLKRKSLFSEQPGDKEDRRVREVWIILDNNADLLYNLQVECVITVK